MDDKQLTDLFRAAADDAGAAAPPPAFDHDDVLAGSQRIARRQRATVAVAVAAMALVSGGAVFSGVLRGPSQTSTLAERPPAASSADQAGNATGSPPVDAAVPEMAPQLAPAPYAAKSAPHADSLNSAPGAEPTAGGAPFAADSAGPSARSKILAAPGGCAGPDPRIFTQLTAVLPAARAAKPYAVPGGCAPGGVGVAVEVVDDFGVHGALVAVLTPPTVSPTLPPDSKSQVSATAHAPHGEVLRLTAIATGQGAIPYRARLGQLATALAAHL